MTSYIMYITYMPTCMYIYICDFTCVLVLLLALGEGSFQYATFTTKMSAQ